MSSQGDMPPNEEELAQIRHALRANLGRLQPLMDDPDLESIEVRGVEGRMVIGVVQAGEVKPLRGDNLGAGG